MHSAVADHLRAIALFRSVLTKVAPPDLPLPTPCSPWQVRELLAHQLGQDRAFTAALRGGASEPSSWAPEPVDDDVPAPSLDALDTQEDALRAFGDPADRTIWMPEILPDRPLPADRALAAHLIDLVVHSWDLGVSIGAVPDVPDDLVELCLRIARAIPDTDETRGPDRAFVRGLDLPVEVGPFHEVLRRLGRDPAWAPPEA